MVWHSPRCDDKASHQQNRNYGTNNSERESEASVVTSVPSEHANTKEDKGEGDDISNG